MRRRSNFASEQQFKDRWCCASWFMVVRNTLCKRTIVAYLLFFATAVLIWQAHEKSIRLEESESVFALGVDRATGPTDNSSRLDFWTTNNSKTLGFNLTAILAPKQRNKYLVYVCHETCGGWGDRLRGIMSLFMISLMLDRNFRIEITHPCALTNILRPNLYNWTRSIDGLVVRDPLTKQRRYNLTRKMLITTANAHRDLLENVSQILTRNRSINSIWSEDVLYWATNKDYFHQLSENLFYRKKFKSYGIMTKYLIKLETLFPLFYEILFRPVMTIDEEIRQYKAKRRRGQVICAQIRTGQNPTIPGDKFLPGRRNISESIFSFIDATYPPSATEIFLTTDNQNVFEEAKERYGPRLLYVEGTITHLDRSANTDQKVCREQKKLLTDFHLLGEFCDVSIISNSGFGFWGNLRRFRAFDQLFVFCAGRIYKIDSMWHLYKMREQNHHGEAC